jgi:hypothetical protein
MALSHDVMAASGVDWSTATVLPVLVAVLDVDVVGVEEVVDVGEVVATALVDTDADGVSAALLHPARARPAATRPTITSCFTTLPVPDATAGGCQTGSRALSRPHACTASAATTARDEPVPPSGHGRRHGTVAVAVQ